MFFKSIRGRTVVAAIFDECAFWVSEAKSSRMILAAVRPGMRYDSVVSYWL
jgi:hypothetical protein